MAVAIIAFLAGTVVIYFAVRMIRSREFVVAVSTAKWNPQSRMYVKRFGLDRWVNITMKVVAPILLIVGIGLWVVAVWFALG
jgi:hypothetical protein